MSSSLRGFSLNQMQEKRENLNINLMKMGKFKYEAGNGKNN